MALRNCVVVAQAKGGVGKTTIATNLAGIWAAQGLKVLLFDFDPQGNCALDLGYEPQDGRALFQALATGTEPPVLRDVRPNLDVIPSGPALARFAASLMGEPNVIEAMAAQLADAVALAGEYDVVVIDTPPGDVQAGQAAMVIGSHVVAPARADDASLLGTIQLAQRYMSVRRMNPDVQFAGVVLFGIGAGSRRIERRIREQLEATLAGGAPVLAARIREANGAAVYARTNGRLATEIVDDAAEAAKERFAALREGRHVDSLPSNAAGLAADFQALADEVAGTMTLPTKVA